MEKDFVIAVNSKDQKIGLKEKTDAHLKDGVLHRAFVVFVSDGSGKVLIQKRSKDKMLWPFYWECTIASHPRIGEDYIEAGERRLKEELGFVCPLKFLDKFQYSAKYKNIGAEREVCAVLVGKYAGEIKLNLKEVADFKWIDADELKNDISKYPGKYAPWLMKSFDIFWENYEKEENGKKEKIESALVGAGKMVNPIIEKILNLNIEDKFHEIVDYQILAGGKRIRPAVAIASCKLFGGKIDDVLYPAAGLEIIHNYSLIVDDIIDNSDLRRGKPTVWAKFGKSVAQCVGIYYSAAVFQAADKSKNALRISEIFTKAIKAIVSGEILDILFERRGREDEPYIIKNRYRHIGESDYLEMISKKTAALFQYSCEIGGICAGAKEKEIKTLGECGFSLGIIFQISDDILDIFGDEKKFGKKIGKDIEDRKASNIIIINALSELPDSDKWELNKIFEKNKISDTDIKRVIKMIKKTNALEKAEVLREKFIRKTKENLKLLPQNQWNALLVNLVDFVANREK